MTVKNNYNIDFSNISEDTIFVIDTNVLYFVHSGYTLQNSPKCQFYSNLIQRIMDEGFIIKISSLTVQELLYCIENKEYEMYRQANGLSKRNYSKKDYRKDVVNRNNVKSRFKTILMELSIYQIENAFINLSSLERFVDTLQNQHMDPVDFLLSENFDQTKTIFVSDDRDFSTLANISVFSM